ncbi:hypothetical protein HAX54_051937, partial [Datura stramonium]|nr:hypothetical protein [Datura stramonium]
GVKEILHTFFPSAKISTMSQKDVQQFSFLSGFKEKDSDEQDNNNDEASRKTEPPCISLPSPRISVAF